MCISHITEGKGNSSPLILLVEDDTCLARLLTEILSLEIFDEEQTFYQIKRAVSSESALPFLRSTPLLLCIFDHHPPVIDGLKLYDQLCTIYGTGQIPTLLISNDLPQRELARRQFNGLQKPFNLEHFIRLVQTMIGVHRVQRGRDPVTDEVRGN